MSYFNTKITKFCPRHRWRSLQCSSPQTAELDLRGPTSNGKGRGREDIEDDGKADGREGRGVAPL